MLTRLEVSGFKNLRDMKVDFGPFTCIMGENGVGKSNIFDVIAFLSSLTHVSFGEAVQSMRAVSGSQSMDIRDIFYQHIDGSFDDLAISVEMLAPRVVEDDLGSPAEATTTFLRYEIILALEMSKDPLVPPRAALRHESLTHITKGEAPRHLPFPHSAKDFRQTVVHGQRRGGAFLSTESKDGILVVNVHGDGGSFGRPQPRPARRTNRTILSTLTTNDHPTALAARREMQSWRRLSLEPTAMRTSDNFTSPSTLGVDGSHMAATLWRIAHATNSTDPEAVYARIADRLSDLLEERVVCVGIDRDTVRETLTLFLEEGQERRLPSRVLSEGTLRFLALCILLEDPTFDGLICMEEPENGIHPAHLPSMMQLVRDIAVDSERAIDAENPFRQVIVNTHSPSVVQLCSPDDIVMARTGRETGLTMYSYEKSWRAKHGGPVFSRLDALPYLTPPAEAQFELPLEFLAS